MQVSVGFYKKYFFKNKMNVILFFFPLKRIYRVYCVCLDLLLILIRVQVLCGVRNGVLLTNDIAEIKRHKGNLFILVNLTTLHQATKLIHVLTVRQV